MKLSLAKANTALARQWHPTKNAPLMPKDVTSSSHKKVWWLCKRGHEWEAVTASRSKGAGCPYCSGHKVSVENCLQATMPNLSKQWHLTKNLPLTSRDISKGSNKKVWWLCRKGHEWQAMVANRSAGKGCPYCSSRMLSTDNSLLAINPKLAREWHDTKNAGFTARDVAPKSHKKVWWVCKRGHEWEATVANRSLGRKCPYCSRNRVSKENSLQIVNPRLAREWHHDKNAPLSAMDVAPHSNKKVWWICQKGHVWKAVIKNRSAGRGCSFCSGHRTTKENSLEAKGPWLAKEWHPSKNAEWTPKDLAPFSKREAWWKCKKGHEHRERVIERYKRGGCPECVLKRKAPRLFETKEDGENNRI